MEHIFVWQFRDVVVISCILFIALLFGPMIILLHIENWWKKRKEKQTTGAEGGK